MYNIILILGYVQSVSSPSGLGALYDDLKKEHPHAQILLYKWNTDISTIINDLVDGPVALVGYSYGGFTANRVAQRLKCLGKRVEYLFLIDAIWRPRDNRASLRSLNNKHRIFVSSNVNNLYSWRQRSGGVKGHNVWSCESTKRHDYWVNARHVEIDNHKGVHDVIKKTLWAAGA